jgi:hypothetical protein
MYADVTLEDMQSGLSGLYGPRLYAGNVQPVRCCKNVNPENISTYDTPQTELTPQLTPASPKSGGSRPAPLPSDLAEIMAVWPKLPEHIKAAITTLVRSAIGK